MKLFFLIFITTIANAQITVSDVLSSASNKAGVKYQNIKLDYLQSKSFEMPIVKSMQLQLNTQQLTSVPRQYTLKFQPQNFGKIRLQRQNYHQMMSQAQTELTLEKIAPLKDKYTALLDLNFANERLKYIDTLSMVLNDAITVYKKHIAAGNVDDIGILTDLESDLVDLRIKKLESESTILEKMILINEWTDGMNQNVSFSKVSSMEMILASLAIHTSSTPNSNIALIKKEQSIVSSLMKKKMIQSDNRTLINYYQFRYADSVSRGETDYKQWSAGISINIPFPNENKLKIQNAHLDYLDAIKDFEKEKEKLHKELFGIESKLVSKINQFSEFEKIIKEYNQNYNITDYTSVGYKDLKTLYRMKIRSIEQWAKSINYHEEVLNLWVDYCEKKGILSLRNWIEE
jgi:hypothetical protein